MAFYRHVAQARLVLVACNIGHCPTSVGSPDGLHHNSKPHKVKQTRNGFPAAWRKITIAWLIMTNNKELASWWICVSEILSVTLIHSATHEQNNINKASISALLGLESGWILSRCSAYRVNPFGSCYLAKKTPSGGSMEHRDEPAHCSGTPDWHFSIKWENQWALCRIVLIRVKRKIHSRVCYGEIKLIVSFGAWWYIGIRFFFILTFWIKISPLIFCDVFVLLLQI